MTTPTPPQLNKLRGWTVGLVIAAAALLLVAVFLLTNHLTAPFALTLFTLGGSVAGIAIIVGVGAAVLGGVHTMLHRPEPD